MIKADSHQLAWRPSAARIVASIALGGALAALIVSHGISASDAQVQPGGPPGTAAAQLSVLTNGPITKSPPSGVATGFAGASAQTDAIRVIATNVGRLGLGMFASVRSNGGACTALSDAKGGVGTVCVDDLPASGITLSASDPGGWQLYGFAADDVVSVDVVLNGTAQPATMLANAYLADLGSFALSDAKALVVRHADGSVDTVANDLRAPGS